MAGYRPVPQGPLAQHRAGRRRASQPANAPSSTSIPDREALAGMVGFLQLIDEGNRIVVVENCALAVGPRDQLVLAEPELAGALAGADQRCGREKGPVQLGVGAQQPQ